MQRIDLGGVIRESTMGLTMETVDAVRSEAIEIDGWAGACRRQDPVSARSRATSTIGEDVVKGEIRNERSRDAQGQRAGFVSQVVGAVRSTRS